MRHRLTFVARCLVLSLLALSSPLHAGPTGFNYSGRIIDVTGKPVVGPVDLEVTFFDDDTAGNQIGPTKVMNDVPLKQGLFQIIVDLTAGERDQVFGGAGGVFMQIKDLGTGKKYPRQSFGAVPYALRVPVDGTTIGYNADGQLEVQDVSGVPQSGVQLDGGVNDVTIKAAPGSDPLTLTLPDSVGTSGYVLTTDGLTGALTWTSKTSAGGGDMLSTNNLGDVANAATARTNLGIGSVSNTNVLNSYTQNDSQYIASDEIRARDAGGLKLFDDGTNGIFVQDGGNVGIGTTDPGNGLSLDSKLHIAGSGTGILGRTALVVQNASADSAAQVAAYNSTGKSIQIQAAGPSYLNGEVGSLGTSGGLGLALTTDGDIASGGTSEMAFLTGGFSAANERMRITSTGNVGVGTTSPAETLHVAKADTANKVNIDAVVNADHAKLQLRRAMGTTALPSLVTSGASLGTVSAQGYDGAAYKTSAQMSFNVDGPSGADSMPTRVSFYTSDGTSPVTLVERMRIDRDGEVGIGTTSPGANLHVRETAAAGAEQVARFDVSDDASSYLAIANSNSADGAFQPAVRGFNSAARSALVLEAIASTDSGTNPAIILSGEVTGANPLVTRPLFDLRNVATSRLLVQADGDVGIGTTSPEAKLHVAGQVKITGGTPGDGKVLVSDNTGLATWSAPPAGVTVSNAGTDTKIQTDETPGEDKIRFDTNGAERMIIDATGNVGIGTSLPGAKLELSDGTDGTTFAMGASGGLTMSTTHGSGAISINPQNALNLGTVGTDGINIGRTDSNITTVLRGNLQAQSVTNSTTGFQFLNATAQPVLSLDTANSVVGIGTASPLRQLHVRAATGSSEFILETGDGLADWRKWNLYANGGTGAKQNLHLRLLNDAANATSQHAMTWQNDGKVGIGTGSPGADLDIRSARPADNVTLAIANTSTAASTNGVRLLMHADGTNNTGDVWTRIVTKNGGAGEANWSYGSDTSNAGAFQITPNATLGGSAGLTMSTVGNVGINTTNPVTVLDVRGSIGSSRADTTTAAMLQLGVDGNNRAVVYQPAGSPDLRFFVATGGSGSDFMTVQATTGNVGIGTTSPGYMLHVNGAAAKPGGGSWTVASDARLKDVHGRYNLGLDAIMGIKPVYYNYKADNAQGWPSDPVHIGVIAQELREAIPDAVTEGDDGFLAVNNDPVIWALVNSVQELKTENDALKAYLCGKDPAAPFCAPEAAGH